VSVDARTRRGFTTVAIAVATIAAVVAAVAVYGASGRDRILTRFRAAGVDIGGMSAGEARAALARRHPGLLPRPVVLRSGRSRFVLAPRASRVRVDAAGIAGEALARSRQGDPVVRGVRRLLALARTTELPMRVTSSRPAVTAFAEHVRQAIDRPARPADIVLTARGLRRIPARAGLTVAMPQLIGTIDAVLASPGREREVSVPARITRRPQITLAALRARYAWLVTVDRPRKRLRLYRHLRLAKNYPIAVGAIGHKTAAGRYEIQTKAIDPPWNVPDEPWAGRLAGRTIPPNSPQNPLKARWMGFHDGEGVHGTADLGSLGEAASHGCIRMSVPDVEDLYRRVHLHTPVLIR
jgi:lipoprotein-anchoring transpeptidase ErfK/SrfK